MVEGVGRAGGHRRGGGGRGEQWDGRNDGKVEVERE